MASGTTPFFRLMNLDKASMTSNQIPLGSIADIYIGLPIKSSELVDANGVPNVIGVKALTGSGIDRGELDAVVFNDRDVDRYRASEGDVLLSARSTSLSSGIVPCDLDGFTISSTVIGVRAMTAIHPRLFVAWIQSPLGQSAIESISQSGTIQMNLTASGLSRMLVPIIPVGCQRQLVELLEAADEVYENAIQSAQSRRAIARQAAVNALIGNTKHHG